MDTIVHFIAASMLLACVPVIAAQENHVSLDDLRSRIKLNEEMMRRYPATKTDIQVQMQDDLKAAVAQINADLDYFNKLEAKRPSESLKKTISDLQAEMARYQSLLQNPAESPSSATASSRIDGPLAPATDNPPSNKNGSNSDAGKPQTSASIQAAAPAPNQVQNVVPSALVYWIDIAKNVDGAHKKGCSNLPFAQDAGIWNVVISVRPDVPVSAVPDEAKLLNYYMVGNALFLVVQQIDKNSVTLVAGKRTYTGTTVRAARTVDILFEDLTLAEVGDVIDQLTSNPDKIKDTYVAAGLKFQLYRAEFSAPAGRSIDAADYYGILKSRLQPKDVIPVLQSTAQQNQPLTISFLDPFQRSACSKNPAKAPTPACTPTDITIQVQEVNSAQLGNLLQTARIDSGILKKTKQNLTDLINSQNTQKSTNSIESAAAGAADALLELARRFLNPGTAASKQPITIIDNPCFTLSLGPSTSGNFKPVINFKTRYDYFSPSGAFFIKFKGEGDGGDDAREFQRLQGGGEASALALKGKTGWQLSAGGVGLYSVSRLMGATVDEYKIGGKLELQTPFVPIFNTLPGSNSKPALIFEFVSARPNTATKNTFDLNTTFAYTLRPTAELSLDFNGTVAKSSEKRFASNDFYTYFSVKGRYSLFNFADYQVKYECGRKDPDYRKVCSWQTGLGLLVGR